MSFIAIVVSVSQVLNLYTFYAFTVKKFTIQFFVPLLCLNHLSPGEREVFLFLSHILLVFHLFGFRTNRKGLKHNVVCCYVLSKGVVRPSITKVSLCNFSSTLERNLFFLSRVVTLNG